MIYGCRLGGYLLIRERKSASYQKTMKNDIKDGSNMNFALKVLVWVSCALLYCCQVSPVLFRLLHDAKSDTVTVVGTIIMAFGIVLESTADYIKNRYKKQHPHRFCDVGLFRVVRCPNYLVFRETDLIKKQKVDQIARRQIQPVYHVGNAKKAVRKRKSHL